MAGYDLLVIDDFGLMDLNLDKCRDLFEIIEARDCRKSTVIISQMPVANWYQCLVITHMQMHVSAA
ncbi:MAG: ATP-binding protein [Dorea sp.]